MAVLLGIFLLKFFQDSVALDMCGSDQILIDQETQQTILVVLVDTMALAIAGKILVQVFLEPIHYVFPVLFHTDCPIYTLRLWLTGHLKMPGKLRTRLTRLFKVLASSEK